MNRLLSAVASAVAAVSLAACAGGSSPTADATSVADVTTTASAPATADAADDASTEATATRADAAAPGPGAPEAKTVAGYSYTAPSPTIVDQMATAGAMAQGVLSAPTVVGVEHDGAQLGGLVLFALEPTLVGNTAFEGRLLDGIVSGMAGQGASADRQTIAGLPVVVASTADGLAAVAWYTDGVVGMVLSDADSPAVRAFVQTYLSAG
jgi:hypothetical protein